MFALFCRFSKQIVIVQNKDKIEQQTLPARHDSPSTSTSSVETAPKDKTSSSKVVNSDIKRSLRSSTAAASKSNEIDMKNVSSPATPKDMSIELEKDAAAEILKRGSENQGVLIFSP